MPTRRLEDACTILQESVPRIISTYNGRYSRIAKIGEVLRTTEEQKAKYAQGRITAGRIVTYADGIKQLSNHQAQTHHGETCSHAVDINIFTAEGAYLGSASGEEMYYWPLIGLAVANGVESGGEWKHPDFPHLQCPYVKG